MQHVWNTLPEQEKRFSGLQRADRGWVEQYPRAERHHLRKMVAKEQGEVECNEI